MLIKILSSLVCLVTAAQGINPWFIKDVNQDLLKQLELCAKEVSATSDDVAALASHQAPKSPQGKCMFFCLNKLYNAQNTDGSRNTNGALANFENLKSTDGAMFQKIETILKKCDSAPTDPDPCVNGINWAICLKQAKLDYGINGVDIQ